MIGIKIKKWNKNLKLSYIYLSFIMMKKENSKNKKLKRKSSNFKKKFLKIKKICGSSL